MAGMAANQFATAVEWFNVELDNPMRYPRNKIGYRAAGLFVERRQRLSVGDGSIAGSAILGKGITSARSGHEPQGESNLKPCQPSSRARSTCDAASLEGAL